MSQLSPIISENYGPEEWVQLARTESSKAIRQAILHHWARANGFDSPTILTNIIKRGELGPYQAASKMVELLKADHAQSTISLYRTQLQTFYKFTEIPFKQERFNIVVPKTSTAPSNNPSDLSHEEIKALLLAASSALRTLLLFLINTGCRISEPFDVRIKDLDLTILPGEVGFRALIEEGEAGNKTQQYRFSFLSSEAVKHIQEYIAGRNPEEPLFPDMNADKAYQQIMALLKQLNLTRRDGYLNKYTVHPHTFRSINLGIAKEADYPESWAEALAGHATGVKGLYHIKGKMAKKWVEKVEPNMRFLG